MLSKKELEDLRPWVIAQVRSSLGFSEPMVVNASLDCVARSLSRQATTDQLSPFLEAAAPKFVEALYRKVLEIKSAKFGGGGVAPVVSSATARKRSMRDVFGDDQEEATPKEPLAKKTRTSRFEAVKEAMAEVEEAPANDAASTETDSTDAAIQIQALLASTRRQIEERKKQTQSMLATSHSLLPTPATLPGPTFDPQQAAMLAAVEKARKAAELQARIQSQLLNTPGLLSATTSKPEVKALPSRPTPLILDAEGRTIDSTGRTINLAVRQPTLKANIRAQQRASFRQITREKPDEEEAEEKVYFDPRVTVMAAQRARKAFKFNEPGKYVKQGHMLRAKTQLEQLTSNISLAARKTGISSATKLALIAPSKEAREEDIPHVEWWDLPVLPSRSYDDCDSPDPREDRYCNVTNLVEHPIPFRPPGEATSAPAISVMLTKTERKKLRKQRRREAEKEKQEKIQFGLMDKPEPKVRISNLMRVLGSEAVQDPTKVEAHVRAQMAERQRKHDADNASRKLTPDQRKAKKLKKLKEDTTYGVQVTVYRVRDLTNHSIKFKVDMNAQQLHLTGCVLLYRDINLVVVEGGPKGLKKFKQLMMHRIKWNPDKRGDDDDDDSDSEAPKKKLNSCIIVWEGMNQDRSFSDWKVRVCPTEVLVREHLRRHSVEHYWDLALSTAIVEGVEEEEDM